jgi:catechol 2,3-dioxygenase-like lactoylglutathione lyase family enzyme
MMQAGTGLSYTPPPTTLLGPIEESVDPVAGGRDKEELMKPRIDVITLAVADFDRALTFYRALGLESSGVMATEHRGDDTHPAGAIVMFHLAEGQILALYPRSELAKDAGISPGPARSGEFSLGHLVPTREEVDALLAKAKAAGAPITELHDRPWGIYSGYFRDPDGHLWEIIHNPNATG